MTTPNDREKQLAAEALTRAEVGSLETSLAVALASYGDDRAREARRAALEEAALLVETAYLPWSGPIPRGHVQTALARKVRALATQEPKE